MTFLAKSTQVIIMDVYFNLLSDEEFFLRSSQMSTETYKYNLQHENCEHLAFLLLTGFKYSSQIDKNYAKKIGANIVGPVLAFS